MPEKEAAQLQPAGRIKDARGKPVTLLDPYSLNLLRRHDIIEAGSLREIAEEVGPGVSKWGRRAYWIGFVIGLYSVSSAIFQRTRSGGGLRFIGIGDVIILLFFIILFGGLHLYLRSARRARFARVCSIMLRHLRCPHCGYDIRGLPVDSGDGATVCPECGCAWRLDNIQSGETHRDVVPDVPSTGNPSTAELNNHGRG